MMTVSSSAASVLRAAKKQKTTTVGEPSSHFSVCALAASHSSLFVERHSGASHLLLSSSSAWRRLSSSVHHPSFHPSGTCGCTYTALPRPFRLSHQDTQRWQGKVLAFPLITRCLTARIALWSSRWFLFNREAEMRLKRKRHLKTYCLVSPIKEFKVNLFFLSPSY